MRNFFKEFAASVLPLLLCSIAGAPEIAGQVNDPVGAARARARVRVTQADRVISETTSDAVGHYMLTVPPGAYVVVASAPHFQAATRALQIAGEGAVTTDFTLALPSVEQTVTVEANVMGYRKVAFPATWPNHALPADWPTEEIGR